MPIKYEISPNSSGAITLAMYIQNTLAMPFPAISPIPIIPIFLSAEDRIKKSLEVWKDEKVRYVKE